MVQLQGKIGRHILPRQFPDFFVRVNYVELGRRGEILNACYGRTSYPSPAIQAPESLLYWQTSLLPNLVVLTRVLAVAQSMVGGQVPTCRTERSIPMQNLLERMIRAAKLEVALYEEVETDNQATGQAAGVVVLSSLAAGLGSLTSAGVAGIVFGTLMALIGWYIWAYMTYFIGTKFLPESQTHVTPGELLRTIGFASAPGLLRLVGIIPGLTGIVFVVASVWMLAAMIIAVRQALDYQSTLRAVGVCAIGWLVQMLVMALVFLLFGGASTAV
jgi:hypothetical protein